MPTSLDRARHIAAVRDHGARLAADAVAAGLDAPVPTCPGWTVRNLLAHQTMIHRWAADVVSGAGLDAAIDDVAVAARPDVVEFYLEGVELVLAALVAAPDDLEAPIFLNDAPTPVRFWARRQAHETAMHGVDAHAARTGGLPDSGPAHVDPAFAIDGLDELLRGFMTRGRSKLDRGTPRHFVVDAVDVGCRWSATVDGSMSVIELSADEAAPAGAAVLRGTAADLYLRLWNRGGTVEVLGDNSLAEDWRRSQHVRWS